MTYIDRMDTDYLVRMAKNDPWGRDFIADNVDDAGDDGKVCNLILATGIYEAWDGGDLHASATDALWNICLILRGYESPDWGNTDGRYAVSHGAGGLIDVEWEALDAGTFTRLVHGQGDYLDPWTTQALADHAKSHGPRDLVLAADFFSDLADSIPE